MEKDILYNAEHICEPYTIGVVCAKKRDGNLNLTPVTKWYTFGKDNNFICLAMTKTSYSTYRVMTGEKFTFCVPDVSLEKTVLAWGNMSGLAEEKLIKFPAVIINLDNDFCALELSCVVFCCRLKQAVDCGDYYVFICEIGGVYTNDKLSPLFSYDTNTALGGVTRPKSVKNDIEQTLRLKNSGKNRTKR